MALANAPAKLQRNQIRVCGGAANNSIDPLTASAFVMPQPRRTLEEWLAPLLPWTVGRACGDATAPGCRTAAHVGAGADRTQDAPVRREARTSRTQPQCDGRPRRHTPTRRWNVGNRKECDVDRISVLAAAAHGGTLENEDVSKHLSICACRPRQIKRGVWFTEASKLLESEETGDNVDID